jgi:hypothetical protein
MSQETSTRPPLAPPKRDMLDRLVVRVPAISAGIGRGVARIPLGSSLRRRVIELQIKRGFAAMARSDIDVVLLIYERDAEVWMRGMSGVGIGGCYRGHDGVRALYADVDDAFDDWAWTIRAVVDGGDRLAVRADFVGYGRGSGARTTIKDAGTAFRLTPRSTVAWQEWFVEQDGWTKTLEAAELRE